MLLSVGAVVEKNSCRNHPRIIIYLCIYRGMNTNNSSKRNKDSESSEKDIQNASTGSVTNVGDTSRDITDTADVARASIAKGRVEGDEGSKTVSTTTAVTD